MGGDGAVAALGGEDGGRLGLGDCGGGGGSGKGVSVVLIY